MKIVTIVGARPQFVKASALSREIKKHIGIEEIIIHTGQHFDANMSDIFFSEMEIPEPKYNLDIHSLNHGAMTGRMMEGIEKVLLSEKPDFTIVYGDTNSTLAGALAARKLNIKVAHIEAGLRSFNMAMPEEINRILTDRISDILFCPTDNALYNLKLEGFDHFSAEVVNCGDIMYDAALFYKKKSEAESKILLEKGLTSGEYIVATLHRQENTDDLERLMNIVSSLNEINDVCHVIVPLHPRTRKLILEYNITAHFTIIDPVGYLDMISLISNASLIMTDSGGLQKESYFFGKYCITLRDQTEWTELVDGGFNVLAGANPTLILEAFQASLQNPPEFKPSLYGDGQTAAKIVNKLNAL
jgi:UDP-GlcNAc3NAcA epimerase